MGLAETGSAGEKDLVMLAARPCVPAPLVMRHLLLGPPTSTRCVCSRAG
jgi:hypothetical protein